MAYPRPEDVSIWLSNIVQVLVSQINMTLVWTLLDQIEQSPNFAILTVLCPSGCSTKLGSNITVHEKLTHPIVKRNAV